MYETAKPASTVTLAPRPYLLIVPLPLGAIFTFVIVLYVLWCPLASAHGHLHLLRSCLGSGIYLATTRNKISLHVVINSLVLIWIILETPSPLQKLMWAFLPKVKQKGSWRDSWSVQHLSSRGSRFDSQHPQLSLTTLSWPPRAPSNKCVHVYMQAKYPQIQNSTGSSQCCIGHSRPLCRPNTQMWHGSFWCHQRGYNSRSIVSLCGVGIVIAQGSVVIWLSHRH